jgi:hypothetical protein
MAAWRVALLVLCLNWAAPACAQAVAPAVATPVAIITEAKGALRILAHGHLAPSEVTSPVEPGAVLALEREARAVLAYPGSGSIYELRGPGRFVARTSGVERLSGPGSLVQRDLASALRALKIRPEATSVQGSTAMRGAGGLVLQAWGPAHSQRAPDAMVVCWTPLGLNWSYQIRLIDDDGHVVFDVHTNGARLPLPELRMLRPGAAYLWQVLARGPNGQSAEAVGQFERLDPSTEQALQQARSVLASGDATDRTLYAIALRQHGLVPAAASGCEDGS